MSEAASLLISRPDKFSAKVRKYNVLIDGEKNCKIKNNEELKISVQPGRHSVQVCFGPLKSNIIEIDLDSSGQAEIYIKFVMGLLKNKMYLVSPSLKEKYLVPHYGKSRIAASLWLGPMFGIFIFKICRDDLVMMEEGWMDDSGIQMTKTASYIAMILFILFWSIIVFEALS